MRRNQKVKSGALIVFLWSFTTVFAPPSQAKLLSVTPQEEAKLGAQASQQIESGARILRGPVEDWVNRVGQKLASASNPQWKYRFRVIDSPEINAFALPGGYIYIYTGMRKIVANDDELAAVLAHEITHAEQRHYAKQYAKSSKRGLLFGVAAAVLGLPQIGQQAVGLLDAAIGQKYSREDEYEADKLGMQRMVRAGFKPTAMISLLEKLDKEETGDAGWFASHPEGGKRVAAAQRELALLPATKNVALPATSSASDSTSSTPTN